VSQGRSHLSAFSLSLRLEAVGGAGHPNQSPVEEGESCGQPGGWKGEAERGAAREGSPGAKHRSTHTCPGGAPKKHGHDPVPREIHQVSCEGGGDPSASWPMCQARSIVPSSAGTICLCLPRMASPRPCSLSPLLVSSV